MGKTMSTGSGTVDGDQTLSHQTNPHTEITVRTMDPQEIEIGDRIRVDTEDSSNVLTPGTFITHTVDRIYYDQRGTTENKECSGRGLCDETSGLCQCFKGYTDDDCSRQNALSAN